MIDKNRVSEYCIFKGKLKEIKNMRTLTTENAKTTKTIRNICHPEWGTKRFNYNDQSLLDGESCSTVGSSYDTKVLFEVEYDLWEVVE